MLEIILELLNSAFPHKWKPPAASCLLSLAHAQNVNVSVNSHLHTNTDTDTPIWANGEECVEVSTGIYWNSVQNSFLILRTWRTPMSSAYFVSEFGDAFAGGCATGLGWFLYGAACSCGFLSKTTLSSLLSQQRAQVSAETNLDREHKQRTRTSQWRGGWGQSFL